VPLQNELLTDHRADWAESQVAVNLHSCRSPGDDLRYSDLEGPNFRNE